MQATYQEAMTSGIFPAEGGYTNEKTDPGGPTNWGITIYDARKYWKADATAEDVKNMPKSVAEDIYVKHYATPILYANLPAGVDYSVLDYAVNSGVSRAVQSLQTIVGTTADGIMGPATLAAVNKNNPTDLINKIWDDRLAYDHSLTKLWLIYGHGWTNRCIKGKKLALALLAKTPTQPVTPVDSPWKIFLSNFTIIIDEINRILTKGKH
jgi:lysozyme family protein